MKANIEVKDRKEGEAIKQGLLFPEVRAFVIVMGVLSTLKSDRAKKRVLAFVEDHFGEINDAAADDDADPAEPTQTR